jgi:uncharacterized delta-60 repeat protein
MGALVALAVGCGGGSGGGASVASHPVSSDGWATAGTVVVDSAGRIIAARRVVASEPGTQFAVSRFTSDGKPDPSFGNGGTAVADLGSKYAAGAAEVALQHDGKIVVFGFSGSRMPDPAEGIGGSVIAIARFLPDGQPDSGFGTGGKLVTNLDRGFAAGAVRPDGRIVILATKGDAHDIASGELVRYLPNGRLDATFGKGGKVDLIPAQSDDIGLPFFGGDGTLLLAEPPGTFADWYSGTTPRGTLARYQPDGRLDPSFGHGGKALIDGPSPYSPLAVQDDGKIVAGGGGGQGGDDFALARYTSDGRLDPSFGSAGSVLPGFGPSFADSPSAVVIQDDGKIIAGGSHSPYTGNDPTHEFLVLVRLTPDGQLDRGFGAGGKVVSKRQGGPVYGLAIQSDGKIVVAGRQSPSYDATESLMLTRYTAGGKLDKSFGDGGTVAIDAPKG